MRQHPPSEVRGPGLGIVRRYASEAEAYRDLWVPVLVRLARWLIDEIPLGNARRILDLGCGMGALLPHLRDASPEAVVVGLDRTQAMVALGPRAFPLLVGDAVRVPFRDRSSTPIGSMPWQSARLHASVAATSSENGGSLR